jgi:hypothetical protein
LLGTNSSPIPLVGSASHVSHSRLSFCDDTLHKSSSQRLQWDDEHADATINYRLCSLPPHVKVSIDSSAKNTIAEFSNSSFQCPVLLPSSKAGHHALHLDSPAETPSLFKFLVSNSHPLAAPAVVASPEPPRLLFVEERGGDSKAVRSQQVESGLSRNFLTPTAFDDQSCIVPTLDIATKKKTTNNLLNF